MADSYELKVHSSSGTYEVVVGEGVASRMLDGQDPKFLLVDRRFPNLVDTFNLPSLAIDGSEETKTLAGVERVIVGLKDGGGRRSTVLLAVGGGVIQDVATLAAALYMRGIRWRYAPTTLMAMADSCIGGKSSINVSGQKNLVGNIYPPETVCVDTTFLATLSAMGMVSGLGEAAKIAYCRGPEVFDRYLDAYEGFWSSPVAQARLVFLSLEAKKWFVEIDEFDTKERRLLNFGHTFGHALETATSFSVPHGVAVALGMMAALAFVWPAGPTAGTPPARLWQHCEAILLHVPELAKSLAGFDAQMFASAFHGDKKHGPDEYRLILPTPNGGVQESAFPTGVSTLSTATAAMERVLGGVAT